ncbi:MAG: YCF48-related protein [Gammaproteobacteria bacterium]|nr:YCF48-related protein [Gammaproteobacteria bacterium]
MSKRKLRVADFLSPVLVVGALVALARVEPEIEYTEMATPAIERRDRFYGVTSPADNVIWLVGKEGKVVRSDDGGTDWRVQALPTVTPMQSIIAWDADHAAVLGNGGEAYYTVDGGVTWIATEVPVSDIAKKILNAEIDGSGRAWATAEFGVIAYSDDKGASWSRAGHAVVHPVSEAESEVAEDGDSFEEFADSEDVAWNDVGFKGAGGVVAVGEFGSVKVSGDNGKTWQYAEVPIESSLMSVAFRDAMSGVAVGLEGTTLFTRDGGLTWIMAPKQTRQHLFAVTWDGKQWVAVGEKGTILFGRPDGDSWKRERMAENEYGWHTDIEAYADGYLVAGLNAGIWSDGKWQLFPR